MHTAHLFQPRDFAVVIDGHEADLCALFPDGSTFDRFGIVVTEPLGSLGASLLIQAAIADFFAIRPERRDVGAAYAEVHVFHVGGPHGDHSYFDFWPRRKEIYLEPGVPISLLVEINARAITRLALPEGGLGDLELLKSGDSTWAEQAAARDRLRSCFLYSPSGRVADADVEISSAAESVERNSGRTLAPMVGIEAIVGHEDDPDFLPGPSVLADNLNWVDNVRARADEIDARTRRALAEERERAREEAAGTRVETFRRIDTPAALAVIAGIGDGAAAARG
jgi:hypothetical protein